MLVRREVQNDVRRAHSAYASLRQQTQMIGQNLLPGSDDLLRIAQTSYTEGEMSLVELLDATEAYRDAQIRTIDLRADLWTRYFDVLRAMGRTIQMP
jgi:cobalt-zinc-cadmium efflux system outer membrane protein